jgi:beta-xylosidase
VLEAPLVPPTTSPRRDRRDRRDRQSPVRRTPLVLLLAVVLAATTLLTATGGSAAASVGGDRFWAGQAYTGEFGAPSIIRVGGLYYAYATNLDGNNLPAMTSEDLVTWRARHAWPVSAGFSSWRGYNDAMPSPARWAEDYPNGKPGIWAPAVRRIKGQYVNAYAVQPRLDSARHCITLATSPFPLGPFRDTSRRPLTCSSDPMGSIDPCWLKWRGKLFLCWKNAGVKGRKPTEIMIRRMTADGLRFKPGSEQHVLLRTAMPWEGNVIEAPSLVRYDGRLYLFYSGNRYTTSSYAIGYAVCASPTGPCSRVEDGPLLATGGGVAGPGAQVAFKDAQGTLRMAYSAWREGRVGYPRSNACRERPGGCNQRRMYVATLAAGASGRLSVVDRS